MLLHLLFSQVLKDLNASNSVLASRGKALEMLGDIFQVSVSWFSDRCCYACMYCS
jgi:hypothetical protein